MENLVGRNILVTGGLGFSGGHLVAALASHRPQQIVCSCRSVDPRSFFVSQKLQDKVILADADLKDFSRVLDILTKYEINTVFHLAAQPIVGVAYRNPLETINTNIMGTANILEACRLKGDLKGIVVASSDKAYGRAEKLPYTEETPLRGDHPYDVSKSCADLLAHAYAKTYDLPVAICRFANIYGPGDLNFNRIIPGIMKAMILDETLEIRSDGQFVRDYIYVKDVVDGYLTLMSQIDQAKGEAFNFSSGQNYSVLELIEKISAVCGKRCDYKILNSQKNEIPKQSLSCEKAQRILGWQSKYSFEKGIKETFAWYQHFFQRPISQSLYSQIGRLKVQTDLLQKRINLQGSRT